MECKQRLAESKIVDYVLKKLDEKKETEIRHHIDDCNACQRLYTEWNVMLSHSLAEPTPSPILKTRILKSVRRKSKISVPAWKNPSFLAMSTCITAVLFAILFIGNVNEVEQENMLVTEEQSGEFEPFLVSEETDIYDITNEHDENIKGYVWINQQSNEMMMLVDGIAPISIRDYQGWIQTKNELKDAGLFTVNGQKGQLYVKDGVVNDLKHIMITQEPKGGSHRPTDPNGYIIKLNAN
jgi:anti-sigma-K factor RskA